MIKKNINRRSFSRFFAVQILYSYLFEKSSENILEYKNFFIDNYISDELLSYEKRIDFNFLNTLLIETIKNINPIDSLIKKNLSDKYNFNDIDFLIKTIFRLSLYEFEYTNTDKKIIINEYVDIAGEYYEKKAISFINANLDKFSKSI